MLTKLLPKHQISILCRGRPQLKRKRLEEDDKNQGYRNRYNLINSEHKRRKTVSCFERKVPDKTAATIMLHQEAFQLCGKIYWIEKIFQMFQNYFTKNIAATWSVIKIIDISIRSAFYSLGYTAQSIHPASQKLLEVT